MNFKDLYIDEHMRLVSELEDRGVPTERAYDIAADQAYDSARNRLADMADDLRQRRKDEAE